MTVKLTIAVFILVALPPLILAQGNRVNPSADWALINRNIRTMDHDNATATAIGVSGDEIIYVGDASGLKNVIGTMAAKRLIAEPSSILILPASG